jgi:DNA-directed RNA polymerase subunit beta'
MRTFHTGGAAGEDITSGLPRVEELFEARIPKKPAVLSEIEGKVSLKKRSEDIIIAVSGVGETSDIIEIPENHKFIVENNDTVSIGQIIAEADGEKPVKSHTVGKIRLSGNRAKITSNGDIVREYTVPTFTLLKVKNGDMVEKGQPLTGGHYDLSQSLKLGGKAKTQNYIIKQVQTIYESQGQDINDKHIEVIIRMMLSKVKVINHGDTKFLSGQIVNRIEVEEANEKLVAEGKKKAELEDIIMGITRIAIKTESFLSAASFQETTSVLIDAATSAKVDHLMGLKENVIIGKLIPAGTGLEPDRIEE